MLDSAQRDKTRSILSEMWQEACERGGELCFKIVSGSMEPMIRAGDVVRVTRAELSGVRIGDILAFKEGRNVLVHRVIGKSFSKRQLVFRHRGDAGAGSGRIAARHVIGKVISIEKEGREIRLDSRRHVIGNRILGWRLFLVDNLRRTQPRYVRIAARLLLRPLWRPCRGLLFRKL